MAGTGEDISGTGDLDITDDLTLNGAGAATSVIDGAQIDRVFDVVGAVTVTFSGITVTHGQAVDCRPAPGLPSCGGAILSNSLDTDMAGTVNITNSVITNSTTTGGGADGGAIFVSGTHRTTNITGTTISGNTTFYGGAIAGGGILSVVSSTISGNSAGFYGGGIYNAGTAVVVNSTFSGNSAGNSGGAILSFTDLSITNSTVTANLGGGVDGYSGTTSVYNSIITGQASGPDCSGSITSHGYNLEGSTSCGFTTTGDMQNANPLLGPLQYNGGPTFTHELLEFSPAINAIPDGVNGCGTTVTTDQRGVSRPQGTGCEIGSMEVELLHCVSPPSGIISWWPAEGNAVDIRGGNDGSLYATASFAGGKVGQAFNFDGEGSVVIPDADSLDVTTSFTLEAWVNPAMQNSYQGAVISKTGGVNGNHGYQLGLTPSTNLLYCEFNAAGEPWPQNRTVSETPVPAGTWSHIACTYDHNILAVYLNGLMIASTTVGPKSVVNSTSNLRISGDDNFALFYKGLVDEPAVYGRALTAGEIQSIDHAGSTGKCSVSATAFDYDGDGKTDISIFRPLDGAWYLLRSTEGLYGAQFGYGDDRIVPADYTGDGRTDVAVFRPSTGLWYILNGSTGRVTYYVFGIGEDLPTPADYDGDGKADISVFRPSTATWYRQNSSDGSFYAIQFGLPEDKPTVGDFDGDGKADIAIFRPSDGAWYQLYSSDGSLHGRQFGFGSDIITPADYDGDGKTDIAVFRPSNGYWYLATSQSETVQYRVFGLAGDIPAVGDFDGDGKADVSVFRPTDGNWYRTNSSGGSFYAYQFGMNGDKPTMTAFRY
jgi:predicted outer membrane repeat protein